MLVSSYDRVPRAGLDPIRSSTDAIAIFDLARARPARAESFAMFLDVDDCGSIIVNITNTTDPRHIVEVAEAMARAASDRAEITGLVLATVRPRGSLTPEDEDIFVEVEEVVDVGGLVLIDWLIFGRYGPQTPRQSIGLPSRWPADHQ